MALFDDEELQPRTARPKPKDLEPLSIEALRDYVRELEAEIARVRAAIEAKESHRSGAESLFRKP
jgi:uncharacterized small protein (DUF1192 family)